jgi:DNA-directed RNA polymerase subunit K/omega
LPNAGNKVKLTFDFLIAEHGRMEIKMIYPTTEQLTKGKFNRYELVVGVAKCARIVTDEYVEMKNKAQKMIENHETDKPLTSLIDPEYKDNKAVKIAVNKLLEGRFKMVRPEE